MDCGPACIRMVASHYGVTMSQEEMMSKAKTSVIGTSLYHLSQAAKAIGLEAQGIELSLDDLQKQMPLPCILHWKEEHYVVLYKISNIRGKPLFFIADPAVSKLKLNQEEFVGFWSKGNSTGIALGLKPGDEFTQDKKSIGNNIALKLLVREFKHHKKALLIVAVFLLLGSALQLILPYLTQALVDIGIKEKDITIVYLILAAQILVILGKIVFDYVRNYTLLKLGNNLNISFFSHLISKILHLPMDFFLLRSAGDVMQRLNEHQRIQSFINGVLVNSIFSILSLIVYSIVIWTYDFRIFLIFLLGSTLYVIWVMLFLNWRKRNDYKRFDSQSSVYNLLMQIVTGIKEIKLANVEKQKESEWKSKQNKVFEVSVDNLKLDQIQNTGAVFINETKNAVITFLVVKSVIEGDLTLGAMLAVQFLLGQLNGPIEQLLQSVKTVQDVKITFDRTNQVMVLQEEEPSNVKLNHQIPENEDITLKNVGYAYPGIGNEMVIQNMDLTIPAGKTTAIVGMSGSGKTTLLNLLIKFLEPSEGTIFHGLENMATYSPSAWRDKCGVVLQDGFIFSDSLANNVAVNTKDVDHEKVRQACTYANLDDLIEKLPKGIHTQIGEKGTGLSTGQKQRIFIARAIYKAPSYIFFDEATNSLDANNEKKITRNLNLFFKHRTVVIVAHRLSTVMHADQIVVLDKGRIVEKGTHKTLVAKKAHYFNLVHNQLDMGQ